MDEERRPLEKTPLFRLGRLLLGGILAFMAIDSLQRLDERVRYAESRGAPHPDPAVPGVSVGLLQGRLGAVLWRRPSLAAAAIAGFFVSVTPVMHDFWNLAEPEAKQEQVVHYAKSTALLGAALVLLRFGRRSP